MKLDFSGTLLFHCIHFTMTTSAAACRRFSKSTYAYEQSEIYLYTVIGNESELSIFLVDTAQVEFPADSGVIFGRDLKFSRYRFAQRTSIKQHQNVVRLKIYSSRGVK